MSKPSKKHLRPIGTVFTQIAPASFNSTNPHPHRLTLKVIGHSKCTDGFSEYYAESVECVKVEELPAPTFIPFSACRGMGSYRAWQENYAADLQAIEDSFPTANP